MNWLTWFDSVQLSFGKPGSVRPNAAGELSVSRRYGGYLATDHTGRPRPNAAKTAEAETFDGKFVIITSDGTLSAEDIALDYKDSRMIEAGFRRME